MKIRRQKLFAFAMICLMIGGSSLHAEVAPPDTPAGHTLKLWLDVFNSGDRSKVENYVKTIDPSETADDMLSFAEKTGGFTLLSIEHSEATQIQFRVKERAHATVAFGSMVVTEKKSPVVVNFSLAAIPPGATLDWARLEAGTRQRIVDAVISNLNAEYIYPEVAEKMSAALKAHLHKGDYDAVTDGAQFANALTRDLLDVSKDKHLHVFYQPFREPKQEPSEEKANERQKTRLQREHCSFDRVENLRGNIGYLKFNAFAEPKACGDILAGAMAFLAHSDAIILDLRENQGGSPAMVSLVASYFFDKPTHLNDLYNRKENKTQQYWTLPYVPGERFVSQPVYVLTSHGTYSGAEELTYDLQQLKRAVIVGETTGGAAHPGRVVELDEHFSMFLPWGRPINPVSQKDWEGTGVVPDVPTAAADALAKAIELAKEKLASRQ